MRKITSIFLCMLVLCFTLEGFSQAKPAQKPKQQKPPKLVTYLNGYHDSVAIATQVAEAIISMPLIVTDANKKTYKIVAYQFYYKRLAVTEDEKTGKISLTKSIVSDWFNTTPLPQLWLRMISQQIKPLEEIRFFDIVAQDENGKNFLSSDLIFTIR